ncbi:hypothetical protein JDA50_15720 [Acinetobacter pittii]|uniref:Uncharacterized protein n=1 Tax=Acinetobacter pittii TaxID=48296 RepID=A0A8I1HAU2_ACIPI|nr:hypothetical protein [Acinetobacter pittii]MBF9202785.1 hypothetical protein [Acinetobacter pittii]MBK1445863.1 hypothetical protein [Acinetobacter pittii]MBW8293250.1 hypothetical protein [Acinetobacter pittii]MCJ9043428.1 hypothetical protein [Acinetobacter pittii]MDX8220456.1 hypothetical protein [Acinetobacter pittii]
MNPEIVKWAMETSSKAKIIPRFPDECFQETTITAVHAQQESGMESLSNHLDMEYLANIKSGKHLLAF